jgi:hypothetical protein
MNPFCEIAVEVGGQSCKVQSQQRLPHALSWQYSNHQLCAVHADMCVLLQEALRLRESKAVDEVVAVSLGPQQVQVGICSSLIPCASRHASCTCVQQITLWTLRVAVNDKLLSIRGAASLMPALHLHANSDPCRMHSAHSATLETPGEHLAAVPV